MSWIDDLPAEKADSISDELKNNPTLQDCDSIEAVAQRLVDTKAMVGRSIRIPGEDAGEGDWADFREKLKNHAPQLMDKPDFSDEKQKAEFWEMLGKPAEASKYEIPEDAGLEAEFAEELQVLGHNSDMTPGQFKQFANEMIQRYKQTREKDAEIVDTQLKELKNEWGLAFPDRVEAAKKINEDFYPGREFDMVRPAEIKSLYSMHETLTGKGAPVAGDTDGTVVAITPAETRVQADEIMRPVHDPKSGLTHDEKIQLVMKRAQILKTYDPRFQEDAAA
jgi:hypothetical protein